MSNFKRAQVMHAQFSYLLQITSHQQRSYFEERFSFTLSKPKIADNKMVHLQSSTDGFHSHIYYSKI